MLSDQLGREINYKSPSLLNFYLQKRRQGIAGPMIMVMIMLHYLPRFGKNEERLTSVVEEITGRDPVSLHEFIEREKAKFSNWLNSFFLRVIKLDKREQYMSALGKASVGNDITDFAKFIGEQVSNTLIQ